MWRRAVDYLIDYKDRQRIAIALAKGVASLQSRRVDPTAPETWEFSGFSQNGEDGIIDVLRSRLPVHNRCVVEIGAADGTENNSSWLLLTERYEGLLVEGNPRQADRARRNVCRYSVGTKCLAVFVSLEVIEGLLKEAAHRSPDVFSLDIDGNDYHIAKALLDQGFRPKIACVEYNSAFGPSRSVSSVYNDKFCRATAHPSGLYYGASVQAWRTLFESYGYHFVTVDSHGVNAFFVDRELFDSEFLSGIAGLQFAENRYQLRAFACDNVGQFSLIDGQPLTEV